MTERSIGSKIKMISGLAESDLTPWEQGFVEAICRSSGDGDRTSHLTEKQIESIDKIWRKHFAG